MIRMTILAPVLALLLLPACNTIAGAGRDLQNAGWAMQSEAQRAGTPVNPSPTDPVPAPIQ